MSEANKKGSFFGVLTSAPTYTALLAGFVVGAMFFAFVRGEIISWDLEEVAAPPSGGVLTNGFDNAGTYPSEATDQVKLLVPTIRENWHVSTEPSAAKIKPLRVEREKALLGGSDIGPVPRAVSADNATIEFSSPESFRDVRSVGDPLTDPDQIN